MPDKAAIANDIYNQALDGTTVNPGVPATLAAFIVQQAMHETNGFTSNAWIQDKNGFGYKYVGSRYQVGKGIPSSEGDFYGRYADYLDSVREIVDWIYRRQKEGVFPADLRLITTQAQYAQYLKAGNFYGDSVSNYTSGLQRWPVDFLVKAAAGVSLVGLAIAVWAVANLSRWSK